MTKYTKLKSNVDFTKKVMIFLYNDSIIDERKV